MNKLNLSLLFVLVSFLSFAQGAIDFNEIFTEKYKKPLKKNKVIGMSLGIIDQGKVAHTQSFGFQDQESNIAASSETEYKIGSISKVFTSIAVLKLQEEGKLDINNSIREYIPEIAIKSRFEDESTLIIKDILCHSSGLPSDLFNGFFTENPKDFNWLINSINQQYMSSPTRYMMSYSNLGYGLIGEMIARISGKSYVEYMKEDVFEPMGLHSTYVFNGEETLSKAYDKGKEFTPDKIRDQAAGSVVSTINDMLLFIDFFFKNGVTSKGQFLNPESMALLEQNHLEQNLVEEEFEYSLGLFLHEIEIKNDKEEEEEEEEEEETLDKYIEHGGDTYAFHAHFGYIKNRAIGGVILTNSVNGGAVNSTRDMLNTYLKEKENKALKMKYNEVNTINKSLESAISVEELKGNYSFATEVVAIEKSDRFSFKVGNQKIKLKEKDTPNTYKATAVLFGLIPIPVKSMEVVLFKDEETIFVSQHNIKKKRHMIIGKKLEEHSLNETWVSRTGKYKVINGLSTSLKELDLSDKIAEIAIEGELLTMKFKGNKSLGKLSFITKDDKMAYSTGIGRNAGYSLTILENGNLYFSGFELELIK